MNLRANDRSASSREADPGTAMSARSIAVPPELRDAYADWDWRVAWEGNPVVDVHRLQSPSGEVRFLKIAIEHYWEAVPKEVARMQWAAPYLPVPEVLEVGADSRRAWFVSRGLDGVDATHRSHRRDVPLLIERLARGLRRFHEAPVADCPFRFSQDDAIERARQRRDARMIDPVEHFHEEHAHLSADDACRVLEASRPADEDLVVCHGDYCAPNVLLDEGGVTGFVDLIDLAVADRWWDLAIATWSVTWNYGPGYEDLFLAAYGVTSDPERRAFYRLAYDTGP